MDVFGEFYSLDEITQMPLEELALFVARAGRNRSPKPEKIAREIKKAARESYRLKPLYIMFSLVLIGFVFDFNNQIVL